MKIYAPVGNMLRTYVTAVAIALGATAQATTFTWTGATDDLFSVASNWTPGGGPPGSGDDVIHSNGDTILFNLGSQGTPHQINSLTVDGTSNGGLEIQADKGLRVNGNFNNTDTDVADRYTLVMKVNSKLRIVGSPGSADLRRVNVTMEPVTSGNPTELEVQGDIIAGDFSVGANCIVTCDGRNSLEGDWVVTDATATLGEMANLGTAGCSLTLKDGSALTIDYSDFYDDPQHPFGDVYPLLEHEIVHGDGTNIIAAGDPNDDPGSGFVLGSMTRIGRTSNSGDLTLSLSADFYIWSDFSTVYLGSSYVVDNWDTRAVDVVMEPWFDSVVTAQSFETISPRLEAFYVDNNSVIFLDVPCVGTWRDLDIPGTTTSSYLPVHASSWNFNAFYTPVPRPADAGLPEHGFFRNITVGQNRDLILGEGGEWYYYGSRTIDSSVVITFYPTSGDPITVTTSSTPSLDEVIIPACGTIYGDWNGDCEITTAELNDLRDAVQEGPYNPLYDSNCDGELTAGVERAKAAANYLTQPNCDCGGESMMFGGGGGSSEEVEAVAAWLSETMSSAELAQFLVDLVDAIEEFEGQSIADDMTALLIALGG